MSFIRRSHFPAFLFNTTPLSKAPQDPQVREWRDRELRATSQPDSVKLAARLIDKALHRKLDALDLSEVRSMTLYLVPAGVLQRLGATLRKLKLPDDCPRDIADRWGLEMPNAAITPGHLVADVRRRRGFAALPHGARPNGPRTPIEVVPPRVSAQALPDELVSDTIGDSGASTANLSASTPHVRAASRPDVRRQRERIERHIVSSSAARSETIQAGVAALRTPMAWLRGQAAMEGGDARCAISAADARALSAALNEACAAALPRGESKAVNDARVVLARQVPNSQLTLSAADVERLSRAMDAARLLGARLDLPAPAMEARVGSLGG